MQYNGIESSSDIGVIVKELCDEGLILKEENDDYVYFDGLFETETIDAYIKNENIKKKVDWYKIISHSLYIIGFIIVVASYATRIPNKIVSASWGMGMLGWALLFFRKEIKNSIKRIMKKK